MRMPQAYLNASATKTEAKRKLEAHVDQGASKTQTEMEQLGSTLANALVRLRELNDKTGEMVARFCNEPAHEVERVRVAFGPRRQHGEVAHARRDAAEGSGHG